MLRLNMLLLLAVMVSALYLVQSQYESRRLFTELDRAVSEARRLETERQRLQVEKRAQATPLRIENLAHAQGLQSATPAITHYVHDNTTNAVTASTMEKSSAALSGVQP